MGGKSPDGERTGVLRQGFEPDGERSLSLAFAWFKFVVRFSLAHRSSLAVMLRQGFEPWSLPREGNMIGRTTLSERTLL